MTLLDILDHFVTISDQFYVLNPCVENPKYTLLWRISLERNTHPCSPHIPVYSQGKALLFKNTANLKNNLKNLKEIFEKQLHTNKLIALSNHTYQNFYEVWEFENSECESRVPSPKARSPAQVSRPVLL